MVVERGGGEGNGGRKGWWWRGVGVGGGGGGRWCVHCALTRDRREIHEKLQELLSRKEVGTHTQLST